MKAERLRFLLSRATEAAGKEVVVELAGKWYQIVSVEIVIDVEHSITTLQLCVSPKST